MNFKRKIIALGLTAIMSVCILITPVFASSNESALCNPKASATELRNPTVVKRINNGPTRDGQVQVVEKFQDGSTLYVELIEENETSPYASTRAAQTKSRTYKFYTKNIFGQKKDAFSVTTTCYWNNNGTNSAIQRLSGTYSISDSDFSCRWDNDHKSETIYDCALPLEVTAGLHGNQYYTFYATLNAFTNPPSLDMGYQSR